MVWYGQFNLALSLKNIMDRIPKQGPNPSKHPKSPPRRAFFDPDFTFCFPKSHKNPGVGGWVNRFGKGFPKKTFFLLAASLKEQDQCIYNSPDFIFALSEISATALKD